MKTNSPEETQIRDKSVVSTLNFPPVEQMSMVR